MTVSRETVDYAIGDMFEELNDCKHHLQHNAKQVKANQYLTKRVAELEAELEQACATALAPVVGGLREEGPEAADGRAGCDCPKCRPPDDARWRVCDRRGLYASILDGSLAGDSGSAFDKPRQAGPHLRSTNKFRLRSTRLGPVAERLWQSADGTAGEWRAEGMDDGGPVVMRVFDARA